MITDAPSEPPSFPTAACFMQEATRNNISPHVLLAVMMTEGGRPGQQQLNSNSSVDLGPMQINTVWIPQLARHYQVHPTQVIEKLTKNGCANVAIGAWILRQKINESNGDVWRGVMRYHSSNEARGYRYLQRVHVNFNQIYDRYKKIVSEGR